MGKGRVAVGEVDYRGSCRRISACMNLVFAMSTRGMGKSSE